MKKRNILIATGAAIAAGYFTNKIIRSNSTNTPEKALKEAKRIFTELGPINGSWIYMKPTTIERNGLTYEAYHGGVTREIDGENVPHEFYMDVDTKAMIDSFPTN